MKSFGYRFYNKRAEYIVDARNHIKEISDLIKEKDAEKARKWLVENIKGIGWKEASHFMRNMGYEDFAILDRHVLKILHKYKIIKEVPKSLTKNKYLLIENELKNLAKEFSKIIKKDISLAISFYFI